MTKQTYIFKTIVNPVLYNDMPDFVLRKLCVNHHNFTDSLNITNIYVYFLPFMSKFNLRTNKHTHRIVDYVKAVDWYLGILIIDLMHFPRKHDNVIRCRSYVKYLLAYV